MVKFSKFLKGKHAQVAAFKLETELGIATSDREVGRIGAGNRFSVRLCVEDTLTVVRRLRGGWE